MRMEFMAWLLSAHFEAEYRVDEMVAIVVFEAQRCVVHRQDLQAWTSGQIAQVLHLADRVVVHVEQLEFEH